MIVKILTRFTYNPKIKNNPTEIIRRCYLEMLGIEPDVAGLRHYTNLFVNEKMDETKLLNTLRNSEEYVDKEKYLEIIRRCYLEMLGREPDVAGLRHYTNLFVNEKMDETKLLNTLSNSKEYLVRISHLELFNSEVNEGGYQFYFDLIGKNKVNKDELIEMMKNAKEYKQFEFRKRFTQKYNDSKAYRFLD